MALHQDGAGLLAGLLLALSGLASAAGLPPAVHRGRVKGKGGGAVSELLTVPADSIFVLQGVTWSSLAQLPETCMLRIDFLAGTDPRGTEDLFLLGGGAPEVKFSLGREEDDGLVFLPGEPVRLVLSTGPPLYPWSAEWRGIFRPASARLLDARCRVPARPLLKVQPDPGRGPFVFSLSLPQPSSASLEIFNAAGRKVRTLQRGPASRGQHELLWDGRDDRGHILGGGVFYALLSTPEGAARSTFVCLP